MCLKMFARSYAVNSLEGFYISFGVKITRCTKADVSAFDLGINLYFDRASTIIAFFPAILKLTINLSLACREMGQFDKQVLLSETIQNLNGFQIQIANFN